MGSKWAGSWERTHSNAPAVLPRCSLHFFEKRRSLIWADLADANPFPVAKQKNGLGLDCGLGMQDQDGDVGQRPSRPGKIDVCSPCRRLAEGNAYISAFGWRQTAIYTHCCGSSIWTTHLFQPYMFLLGACWQPWNPWTLATWQGHNDRVRVGPAETNLRRRTGTWSRWKGCGNNKFRAFSWKSERKVMTGHRLAFQIKGTLQQCETQESQI